MNVKIVSEVYKLTVASLKLKYSYLAHDVRLQITPTFSVDNFIRSESELISQYPHPHERIEMSKLRILCLHGFTSNGGVHAHQVRHITNVLSSEFDFLFPDGPHEVDLSTQMNLSSPSTKAWANYVSANSSAGHRAWWFARDPKPAINDIGGFEGLERSIGYLGELIQRTGPVHVIWGFSQGACFAGMLTALLLEKNKHHPLRKHLPKSQGPANAGIFFSGFRSQFQQYDSIYAPEIETPTMHIMGEQDTAVTVARSESLITVFQRAKVLKHAGGHDIPKSDKDRDIIIQFLRETVGLQENTTF
jgi:predicted esterase